jgi:hypothetical protein
MKKRGISHVEIILSFVLFVVAVGFALYIFSPGGGSRIAESSLDYSFIEIMRNTSTPVETFSVIINKSEIRESLIALNFSGVSGNTSVETYGGENLDSSRFGDLVIVEGLPSTGWSTIDMIYISFGKEFDEDGLAHTSVNESYYSIGSSVSQKIISEKNFLSLNSTYYSNYSQLKGRNQFNLPQRVDFGFSLIFEGNDSIIAEKKIPAGLESFSETRRVEVLRTNGDIVFADLIVKVW